MSVICHELCAESLSLKATRVLKRVEDTFLERANLPFSVVKVSWVVVEAFLFVCTGFGLFNRNLAFLSKSSTRTTPSSLQIFSPRFSGVSSRNLKFL